MNISRLGSLVVILVLSLVLGCPPPGASSLPGDPEALGLSEPRTGPGETGPGHSAEPSEAKDEEKPAEDPEVPTAGPTEVAPGDSSPAEPTDDVHLQVPQVFPEDNAWNTDVSDFPVHPNSDAYIASIGLDTGLHPDFGTVWQGAPIGIPYVLVRGNQPQVPVTFYYDDESDPGPYPIPPNAPIEGGPDSDGDRHVLVIDVDNHLLYELYRAFPLDGGARWEAGSGAIWNLKINDQRPHFWTSADAAGLPIFAGLARYDEVVQEKEIRHALRFTVAQTQRGFILPATHFASNSRDPDRPPMGLRVRLKADYDISGFTENVQVILRAMKRYGMLVADNGSNWYVSGAPDPRWDDDELRQLRQVRGQNFEAVYTGEIVTD